MSNEDEICRQSADGDNRERGSVENDNNCEENELLEEFDKIEFDAIDEEAARLQYRFTQIESKPAPIRSTDSEDDEDFRTNFQSISFTNLDDVWNRDFSYLYPSDEQIDQLVNGDVVLEDGKNLLKVKSICLLLIMVFALSSWRQCEEAYVGKKRGWFWHSETWQGTKPIPREKGLVFCWFK